MVAQLTVEPVRVPLAPWHEPVDETSARLTLRRQIADLERRLGDAVAASFPDGGIVPCELRLGGPRLLTLGELEQLRDALATSLAQAAGVLAERADQQARSRELLEQMLLEPGRYRHVRISQRELGESGCGVWRVQPRLGVVGRLMGWWQIKVSSGCPLAT